MSWLKKFGLVALKVFQVAVGFAPMGTQIVKQIDPAAAPVVDTLSKIAGFAQTIEANFAALVAAGQMQSKNGPQKMIAILPLVSQEVETWIGTQLPGSQKVHDTALFSKGVQEVAQGVVDILNSLNDNVEIAQPVQA